MKILLLFLVFCGLSLQGTSANAKELSLDELRAIQASMKATNHLTVDFTQTNYKALRQRSHTREGKAQFSQPDKFKWMLGKPTIEYKIYDGKDFYDYNPSTNSALRYSPTGPRAYELRQIVDLVMNFDSLLKRYELVSAHKEGDLVKIKLTPKASGEITAIDLHLSVSQSYIPYLKMTMRGGNSLTHEFKNPNRQEIPAATYALPKGVKISSSN